MSTQDIPLYKVLVFIFSIECILKKYFFKYVIFLTGSDVKHERYEH